MLQRVDVYTRGGLKGEHDFCTVSTLAREIMSLNSHATQHFAILQGYARARGQTLGSGVGKAAATVAHELRLQKVRLHMNADMSVSCLQPEDLPRQRNSSPSTVCQSFKA